MSAIVVETLTAAAARRVQPTPTSVAPVHGCAAVLVLDNLLELPLKVVQARLGHASIQMTADVYGHLFPRGDDSAEMAAAERAFLRG
jgi:integrase